MNANNWEIYQQQGKHALNTSENSSSPVAPGIGKQVGNILIILSYGPAYIEFYTTAH